MSNKYDSWTASDAVDRSLLDNDVHYLSGEIGQENVGEAIKWLRPAKKKKKTQNVHQTLYAIQLVEIYMNPLPL